MLLFDEACLLIASAPPALAIPSLAAEIWNQTVSYEHPGCSNRLNSLFMSLSSRLPPSMWPSVDEAIRSYLDDFTEPATSAGASSRVGSQARILIGLCHGSGKIRAASLNQIDHLCPSLAAPLLLIRVNDWVPDVRKSATARLTSTLYRLDPQSKLALVPVLLRLRECGRHGQFQQVDDWLEILATPFDELAWLGAWEAAAGRNKRHYLEILKASGHPPGAVVRRGLLAGNDRLALSWLIREIVPTLDESERSGIFAVLRKSRVVAIKRLWLTHFLETQATGESGILLRETLLDPSKAIRQFSRFHLSLRGEVDFASIYRREMATPAGEARGLTALAEVAPEEAHGAAVSRLDSPVPAVAKAAISALSSEFLPDHLTVLVRSTGSPLPGVSKVARMRLFEIRRRVGTELIRQPATWTDLTDTTRRHLLRLSVAFQKWDGLEFILTHLAVERFHKEAARALAIWRTAENRTYLKLGSERRLKLLATTGESGLPSCQLEQLRFILQTAE